MVEYNLRMVDESVPMRRERKICIISTIQGKCAFAQISSGGKCIDILFDILPQPFDELYHELLNKENLLTFAIRLYQEGGILAERLQFRTTTIMKNEVVYATRILNLKKLLNEI